MSQVKSLLLLSVLLSSAVHALPEQCLQDPARTQPCPHLIYKQVSLSEPQGKAVKQLLCVCLSDFADLQTPATTDAQRINQNMRLKSLSAQLNMSEQDLLEAIRY